MTPDSESDSAAVRWAARLVYCAMAPFVLVGGLLLDLNWFVLRVARTVHNAFGGDDPAVPEGIVGVLYAVTIIATVAALLPWHLGAP